jgi:hypothetical protein
MKQSSLDNFLDVFIRVGCVNFTGGGERISLFLSSETKFSGARP